MATAQFTGRYAAIRKDFYKEAQKKYTPEEAKWTGYKTERGFRANLTKKFNDAMKQIDTIENAGYPAQATITVTFRNHQARATLRYRTTTGQFKVIEYGPTGGYGYDKESTAMAGCFNKSPEFLKILMDARARKKTLPYGVSLANGRPYLPYYDGGVGAECFSSVLKAMGYDCRYIPTADNMSVYEYTLKRKMR